MEIVIDDASPQIEYVNPGMSPQGKHGFWDNGYRSADDPESPKMYKGTFYRSTGQENRVVLQFNATSIRVFGSKWENHGPYTGRIDAGQEVQGDGWSADRQLNQELVSFDNLSSGQEHILTLTNYPSRNKRPEPAAADGWIDVDYILLRHEVQGQVYTSRLEDDSAGFEFDDKWASATPTGMNSGTARRSMQKGASVNVKFSGSSIQIMGGLSRGHGDYSIYLDGVQMTRGRLYHAAFHTDIGEIPLFTASGLEEGPHTVQIVNEGLQGKDSLIDIDFAIVNTTRSDLASANAVTVNPAPVSASSPVSSPLSSSSSSLSSQISTASTAFAAGTEVPPLPSDPAPTNTDAVVSTMPAPPSPIDTTGPRQPNASSGNFVSSSSQGGSSSTSTAPIGSIVGIALGGAALVCILLAAVWFVRRRLHTERQSEIAWSAFAPTRQLEMSQRPASSVFGPTIAYRSEPVSGHPSTLGSYYARGSKLRSDGMLSAAPSSGNTSHTGGQFRSRESGSTQVPYERDRRFDPFDDMSEINGPSPYVPRAHVPSAYAQSQYSR